MVSTGTKRNFTAVLIGTTLLLAGCGQDSVIAPSAQQEFAGTVISLPVAERPSTVGFLGADAPSVTVLVSARDGGSVTMGRYSLDFPPGALSSDTPITIRQADPVAMIVEFEPHGIQFNRPVRVSARVGDLVSTSSKSVGVAWRNDSTGEWQVVGRGDMGETAEADLWHFSDYGAFEE